jgi:hypothetical protein
MRVVFVYTVRYFYRILTNIGMYRKILVKISSQKFCANLSSCPLTVT